MDASKYNNGADWRQHYLTDVALERVRKAWLKNSPAGLNQCLQALSIKGLNIVLAFRLIYFILKLYC